MGGSASSDESSTSSGSSSPDEIGAAGDSPRVRCLTSAEEIVAITSEWRAISPGGLRTINITTAYILMSAGSVYLNELTSVLDTSTSNARSEDSRKTKSVRSNTTQFPAVDDRRARRDYGKERLMQGILPLLQDMAQYRPAAQHLTDRLENALRDREELVRQHEAKVGQATRV